MKKERQPQTKETHKPKHQPTAQIADLPLTRAQAEQVKGGPSTQSKRDLVLKSTFSSNSSSEGTGD